MSLPIEGGGGLFSICARAEVAPRATAARVALASRRAASAREYLRLDMIVLLGVCGPIIGPDPGHYAGAGSALREHFRKRNAGRAARPIPRRRPAPLRRGGTRAGAVPRTAPGR